MATVHRMPPPTGEQIQKLGEEGTLRAKRWLDSTCRAEVRWNNPGAKKKLQYKKAGAPEGSEAQGDFFSFDLGGYFLGGDQDGDVFLAECKKYASSADQGSEYRKFLAKCYLVESVAGDFVDAFLWITWAPFLVTTWGDLRKDSFAASAITGTAECKYIALGTADLDADIAARVASKIILVVLGDAQEVSLSLHGDELLHVRKALLELRAAS